MDLCFVEFIERRVVYYMANEFEYPTLPWNSELVEDARIDCLISEHHFYVFDVLILTVYNELCMFKGMRQI